MRRTNIVLTKKFIRNNSDFENVKQTFVVDTEVKEEHKDMCKLDSSINAMLRNITNNEWLSDKQVVKIEYSIEVIQDSI